MIQLAEFSLTKVKQLKSTKIWKKISLLFPFSCLFIVFGFLLLIANVVKPNSVFIVEKNLVLGFDELLPPPKPYPVNKGAAVLPELTAKSVVIQDIDSSVILYQREPDLRLFPASTTKMMTGLVAYEAYPLNEILTVGEIKMDGNRINLVFGEQITVENLLYGLLVGSGNDAAEVLGANYPGGMSAFILAMNKKAVDLKLTNTNFTNPIGLDEVNHYSSALDLARLAGYLTNNQVLAKIVSTPEITITDVSGAIKHTLKNTNELTGKVDGVKGVKTGWTKNAGECLVTFVEKDGRKIIISLLGSGNRFGETQKLIDWVFNNFEWKVIVPSSYR
ncbi:hypothetical protein COT64_00765 [Candidatus Shapirobacteria bacterium CG09_land_8_20_14_0_10_39_12]|uniref:Peptidase S11 D-alanyl-D-alanine carboxypeptidase A N-terminal domain-containing protein n=1 Tax=Candidatus Shapirobacteria bacterium CG09_land_8_20_14_0_10_39_12 TaxID=1974885 RepID=A0A2H0WQ56_9BACT|nr:MAG: hypothetical protein COT64_00765 [Candidatus Shapirobacteria bacterium CG09_land_8_20_14_0_10_39_12]